jgi:branched-chain amino acid transport system ATP-binding protein
VALGIAQVPQGRELFAPLSVEDNLRMGAWTRRNDKIGTALKSVYDLFPPLAPLRRRLAGTLSGGQQQMLAVARGLMARPRVMLLDEPSLGLAPLLVREIFSAIGRLREQGVTILLVEQMAAQALALADRAYVLERGRIALEGTAAAVRSDPAVIEAYLGRGAGAGPS